MDPSHVVPDTATNEPSSRDGIDLARSETTKFREDMWPFSVMMFPCLPNDESHAFSSCLNVIAIDRICTRDQIPPLFKEEEQES
ncbi:hypothetical protein Bca4012_071337 [Brassica carinata]